MENKCSTWAQYGAYVFIYGFTQYIQDAIYSPA